MELVKRLSMGAIVVLVASEAGAQFQQYTPPGGPGTEKADAKQEIEQQLADARWRLGPFRLVPWLGVRQVAYVDNVFAGATSDQDKVSDLTATAGAGLTAYLPTGSDVYWMVQAQPEYVWWQDLSERRRLTGRYGAGVFGFFNHLELRLTAGREETQGVASSEFPQLVLGRRDHLDASGGLRLTGKLDLALFASWNEVTNNIGGLDDPRVPAFANLDRRERTERAALGFQVTRRTHLALGAEHTESDSLGTRDLSASGTAPTLAITVQGARSTIGVQLARRSLEPRGGSDFAPYRAWNGDFQFNLTPKSRLAYQLYGSVKPSLSLFSDYSHYEERRLGVAVTAPVAHRLKAALFAERGENLYSATRADAPKRQDDTQSYGAQLSFEVTRSLTFSLRASRDDYTSSLPGFDRSVTSVQTGLTFTSSRLLWQ